MIKLKDLLLEVPSVAHSKKSLEWVGHDYIPMTPKVIKQIIVINLLKKEENNLDVALQFQNYR